MQQKDVGERSTRPDEHHTSTTEKGAFCSAVCTCGWRGPARRARSQARRDAADHPGGRET
ncbi:hypothetical protein [Streptomyces macrosporus]|uniref:hypothetical protein n=1 Tax=Streptomyces macrosporus TaxID=44032 RepID=UPI0031DB5487